MGEETKRAVGWARPGSSVAAGESVRGRAVAVVRLRLARRRRRVREVRVRANVAQGVEARLRDRPRLSLFTTLRGQLGASHARSGAEDGGNDEGTCGIVSSIPDHVNFIPPSYGVYMGGMRYFLLNEKIFIYAVR